LILIYEVMTEEEMKNHVEFCNINYLK
jgi:hypothetical protein